MKRLGVSSAPRLNAFSRRLSSTSLLLFFAACSHQPPEDFAPDPGLVAQIRDLRVSTTPARACPGAVLRTSYEAVLTDGSRVPFARSYDKKHPPRLHVVFLERSSPDGISQEDGDWVTTANPLWTAVSGIRLTAALRAKPDVRNSVVIPPEYSCLPHAFSFSGEPGGTAQAGDNGPDVTVRLAILRSPFYDRLLVAGVEVGLAPPFYVLADGSTIPPADWLVIESRGGRGGTGAQGPTGADGAAGASGCPAQPGGNGGNGGNGGQGGAGGRGGRVNIIVSAEEPFLAGVVDARSRGGAGGPGGPGANGGKGGKGGQGTMSGDNRRCPDGADGAAGQKGTAGPVGQQGYPGPRPQIVTLPARDVFGPHLPPELAALMERAARP
jgi:hypothetical protein